MNNVSQSWLSWTAATAEDYLPVEEDDRHAQEDHNQAEGQPNVGDAWVAGDEAGAGQKKEGQ